MLTPYSPDPQRSPADDLAAWIAASPTPYHCVATAATALRAAGFREAAFADTTDPPGRWFVRRGGFLFAWANDVESERPPVKVVGAHTDSPNLRLRPHPNRQAFGWRQFAVEVYGGALLNSWLDRDLAVAGRVGVEGRLVGTDQPICRVPQLAIHLDPDLRTQGLRLDPQAHAAPVFGVGSGPDAIAVLCDVLQVTPTELDGFDLMLHPVEPPRQIGAAGDLFAAPRLDNQLSCWAAIQALCELDPGGSHVAAVVLFDHEEVGSTSADGAAGVLAAAMVRRCLSPFAATQPALPVPPDGSWMLSCDMAHATHPNYPERHEPGHLIVAGAGPVVKVNSSQRYASDGPGIARLHRVAQAAGLNLQSYSHRGDMACGSTIGPLVAAACGLTTTDVGAPQLSMHSSREVMATADIDAMKSLLAAFFADDADR